jgi:hypothetical protein
MSKRLVILLGEFDSKELECRNILEEWSGAGLLDSVAWCDVAHKNQSRPMVRVHDEGRINDIDLFELLVSRIWDHVSVVAVRQSELDGQSPDRFENETKLLRLIEEAFDEHRALDFNCMTVSVAATRGLRKAAFDPTWRLHVLQEPVVRIDDKVAAQPIWDEQKPLLVLLLGLASAGGFIWQNRPLISELVDPSLGSGRPLRVGRAYIRVVSAGRLTDEILAGAFPASGPWSIPPDVANARAVPPGTIVPDSVLNSLTETGGFRNRNWSAPKGTGRKPHGIIDGIKLFFKEFVGALKGIPYALVSKIKSEMEDWVTKVTFGRDSSILLKFDPNSDVLELDEVLGAIKFLDIGVDVDPIGDPAPWQVLQQVALSSVDGGRFPSSVQVPTSGPNRLVFTDPAAIGPSPDDSDFVVTEFEKNLLGLKDANTVISPMDVESAHALQTRLTALRRDIEAKDEKKASTSKTKADATTDVPKVAVKKSRKQRRLEKKAAKKAVKNAKKNGLVPPINSTVEKLPETPTAENDKSDEDISTSLDSNDAEKTPDLGSVEQDAAPVSTQGRHKPSHPDFRPEEYVALCSFYQGDRADAISEYLSVQNIYDSAFSSYGAADGYWKLNKTCDHCGTAFDHGVLYLHEPTQKLVHVGHICARKVLAVPNEADLIKKKLLELETRWAEWLGRRSGSLLWRVGNSIISGLVNSRASLARLVQFLNSQPEIEQKASEAQIKFGRWTRRGLLFFVLLIAASVASVILTPLPLLLFVGLSATYFAGLIVKIFVLARELVRAQFRRMDMLSDVEMAYLKARHEIAEIVRLGSIQDQFDDWQLIIRQLVHVPFGREIGFQTSQIGISEVQRPPAMVLGTSRPDDKQKMQLFLNARRQTVHAGWLTEIFDIMREEWKADYENARITTPADNILPEADNASSRSIVGKKPLTDEDVYYPRTDLRVRLMSGVLQKKLVARKAEQVAEDLRRTSLRELLAEVEVTGLGSALSGQTVNNFLSGLSIESEEKVPFPPDLISNSYAARRSFFPEETLPPYGSMNADIGQIQVQPGVELTAAAWRVEFSGPLHPFDVLRGFDDEPDSDDEPPMPSGGPVVA